MKQILVIGSLLWGGLSFGQNLQTVTNNGSTTDKVITVKGLTLPSYGGSVSGADKWFNLGNFSSSGDFYMTRSAYHDAVINANGLQHQTTGTNSVALIGGGLQGFGIAISVPNVTAGQNWNWQNDLKFKVGLDGNVGIGTTAPQSKLEVNANGQTLFRAFNANANIIIGNGGSGDNFFEGTTHYFRDALGNQKMNIQSSSINAYVQIISNQRVLIGASDAPSNYLLAVNGSAIAQKVVVKQNIFADYVFKPEYKLRPLSEVEQYINQNGHLPNIPKEEEIKKNGLDLGDMNVKLLEKVEELTLYLIEMKKENEALKKRMQVLENKK
jgi:hypothetical protein